MQWLRKRISGDIAMKILVDIDSTLNDLVGFFCNKINEKRNANVTPETLENYDMTPWLEPGGWARFLTPGMFLEMEPLKDSKKVLKKMSQDHEIIIVSDTGPMFRDEKKKWLKKHYPFIKDIIFTGQKSDISGDIIIDDNPIHLMTFQGHKITLTYGYNKNIEKVIYTNSWKEIEKAVEEIICQDTKSLS